MGARAHDGKIGVGLAATLVAGNMVGSGVYLLPSVLAGDGGISILGWAVALAGALLLAAMYAMLSRYGLDDGAEDGLIGRIAKSLGPFWGYQAAALYLVSCWVGNVAIALAVTGYAASFVPALKETAASTGFTLGVILVMTLLNIFGSRLVSRLQGATLLIGLAPVLVVGVAGWIFFKPALFAAQWNVSHHSPIQVLGSTMLPIFWAFLGLESASFCAARVRDPARNIGRATLIGVALAGLIYAGACVVLLGVLPAKALTSSTAPFADGAQALFGLGISAVIAVCAMIRASGTLAGWILVAAETGQSAAAADLFPKALAPPGPKATFRTLWVMAVIMGATVLISASPSLSQQFSLLINGTVLLTMVIYVFSALSLWRLAALEADDGRRAFIRVVCGLSILFCGGVILTSDRSLIGVALGLAAVAGLAYAAGRFRATRRANATI